jgi:hypothetical protein
MNLVELDHALRKVRPPGMALSSRHGCAGAV